MNWQLLFTLVGGYVALFFLLTLLLRPGLRYLRNRFQAEFGLPLDEQNLAGLQPEQLARWASICGPEFARTPYRWLELAYFLFHYPSIVVLSFGLRRNQLPPWQMFFVTGATHVTLAYWQWHR